MVLLRLRSPTGTHNLTLADSATLSDLRAQVEQATGVTAARQELRLGFPPKPLDAAAALDASLASLGIKSGETIVVVEGSASVKEAAPSSSSTSAGLSAGAEKPDVSGVAVAQSSSTSTGASSVPQKRGTSPTAVPSTRSAPIAQPSAPAQPAGTSSEPAYVEADGGFLVLRQVPDDNSCLFRAVGLVLNPGETDVATSLRHVVAGAIQADPDEYSEVVLGRTPEQYIETILRPSSWGGAIELAIFAKHFQTEIWSIDVQTGRVDRFGEGAGYETFALIVYSGIHYDALTFSYTPPEPPTSFPPPNLDFDTTVLPRYQEHLLDAAQTLVGQLRAQHAYTDTASFTLKCGVCGQALRGEKEARKHAEGTGHTSFTEYDG